MKFATTLPTKLSPQIKKKLLWLGYQAEKWRLQNELEQAKERIKFYETKYKGSITKFRQNGFPVGGWTEHSDFIEWEAYDAKLSELKNELSEL